MKNEELKILHFFLFLLTLVLFFMFNGFTAKYCVFNINPRLQSWKIENQTYKITV